MTLKVGDREKKYHSKNFFLILNSNFERLNSSPIHSKNEKIISIIINLGIDKYNKQQRQANFILSNRYLSPYPVHSSIGHPDKSIHQHLSYDKSIQCRRELVKQMTQEKMQFLKQKKRRNKKSTFQANSLTALCFSGGPFELNEGQIFAIWTKAMPTQLRLYPQKGSDNVNSMKLEVILIKIKIIITNCWILLFPPH